MDPGATLRLASATVKLVLGAQAAAIVCRVTGDLEKGAANPVPARTAVIQPLGFVWTGRHFICGHILHKSLKWLDLNAYCLSKWTLMLCVSFYFCSYTNNQVLNVPIGGKIPEMDDMFPIEEEVQWSKELAVSALQYTGDVYLHCADSS